MRRTFPKTLSLLLAAVILAMTAGCGILSDQEISDLAEAEAETGPLVVTGKTTGEALQDTYKADHRFSINSQQGASFNPYLTTSAWNRIVGMLVYDTLVRTDSSFNAQPNLVTRWESADGVNWTFYVDTSRSFHDGGVMTALDAATCIDQARQMDRYGRRFSHVQSVGVVDTESFTVTLDQINWRFMDLLNIPCVEAGSFYSDMPPGTGPYKFNSRGTVLNLFTEHPQADEMPLKNIYLKRYTRPEDILQAFEDSLLDLVTNNPADASSLGYSRSNLIKYVETTNLHYVGFNMRSQLFSYAPFRQLVTYAIDRDTIVANTFQGSAVAATLPIHPNSSLYPKAVGQSMEFSPETLATVLNNMGAADLDQDGVIEFGAQPAQLVFLVCTDSGGKVSAARQIANQLRSVGFNVTMAEMGYSSYIEALEKGEYDMYYGEVKLCNDWDLSPLLVPGGALNYGGVSDGTLTNYLQTFMASDEMVAPVNAETLCSYLAEAAPIIAVCFERTQVLYHRGAITTINPTQDNYFNDFQDWQINLD